MLNCELTQQLARTADVLTNGGEPPNTKQNKACVYLISIMLTSAVYACYNSNYGVVS